MNRNVQVGWKRIKWGIDKVSAVALGASTYDSLPANRVSIGGDVTTLKLAAFGTGSEDDACTINIYGGYGQKGREAQPTFLLGTVELILGTMQANHDPTNPELSELTDHFYCDDINVTFSGGLANIREGNDNDNNRIGTANIRLTGESWIYIEVSGINQGASFNLMGVWINETIPET